MCSRYFLDADGNPTNDPNVLYGSPPGALLPLGGAGGQAEAQHPRNRRAQVVIADLVELVCAAILRWPKLYTLASVRSFKKKLRNSLSNKEKLQPNSEI